MKYGDILKKLRIEKGLSQQELADRLNINRSTYARYETSATQPDFDTLKMLAEFHDVSTDYILGRTDDPQGYINISYDGGGLDIQDEEEEEYLRVQLAEFRKMRERMKKRLQEQQKKEQ